MREVVGMLRTLFDAETQALNESAFRAARRDRRGNLTEYCDHSHSGFGALACAHERGWDAIVSVAHDADGPSRAAFGFHFVNENGRWRLVELKPRGKGRKPPRVR